MPPAAQPQPTTHRDPALDGLRGLAVFAVFLFHYGGGLSSTHIAIRVFGYLSQAGWTGVHLFFALSGFLITGLLIDNLDTPHALRNFYARRALRILPLYYTALVAAFAAAVLAGAHMAQLKPLLVYAAFVQNLPPFLPLAQTPPPPLPLAHLWSLAVEEQFYLVWPFLFLAVRSPRRRLQLCLALFLFSCAFRALLFAPHLFPSSVALAFAPFPLTRAGALALGGALAILRRSYPSVPLRSPALLVFAIGAFLFLLSGWHAKSLVLSGHLPFIVGLAAVDLACAALVALSLHPGALRRGLSNAPLRWLGRISYGFYVLHILLEPLFDRLGRLFIPAGAGFAYQTVRLLLAFPITAAAAWLSFTLLERPFLRLKRLYPRREIQSA